MINLSIPISIYISPADGDINDVLIKTLAEAHANTNTKLEAVRHVPKAAGECLSLKPESIPLIMEHIFLAVQDVSRILYYKNLGQEELWLDCAEKLTQ